nr:hypothetical protein [Mangrovicoccus ximenensis]
MLRTPPSAGSGRVRASPPVLLPEISTSGLRSAWSRRKSSSSPAPSCSSRIDWITCVVIAVVWRANVPIS